MTEEGKEVAVLRVQVATLNRLLEVAFEEMEAAAAASRGRSDGAMDTLLVHCAGGGDGEENSGAVGQPPWHQQDGWCPSPPVVMMGAGP